MDFISFRIAGKGYSIYKMSPLTATRIMQAWDVKKEPDKSIECLAAMARSVALGISGSKSIFSKLKRIVLRRRFMKKASFEELFDAYNKTLKMIPLEDIVGIGAVMEQLSMSIAKDHE